jgi:hypothetical protein
MTNQLLDGYNNTPLAAGQEPANYHAWLLRIWREYPDEPWRVTLQRTDGERIGFPELQELFEYLLYLTQEAGSRK